MHATFHTISNCEDSNVNRQVPRCRYIFEVLVLCVASFLLLLESKLDMSPLRERGESSQQSHRHPPATLRTTLPPALDGHSPAMADANDDFYLR